MDIVTNFDGSVLNTFRACPRRFFYNYTCNIVADTPRWAADFGTAIHEGLAELYQGRKDGLSEDECTTRWEKGYSRIYKELLQPTEMDPNNIGSILNAVHKPPDKYSYERGLRVLAQYQKTWQREDFKIKQVEVGFAAELSPGILFGGRKDLVVSTDVGTIIIDHKTTSRFGDKNMLMTKPNAQGAGYAWDEFHYTHEPVYFALNWIHLLKAKTNFERTKAVEVTTEEVREWKASTLWTIRQVLECAEKDYWPGYIGGCYNFFGTCPYVGLCKSMLDPCEVKKQVDDGKLPFGFASFVWEPFEGFMTIK